MGVNQLTEEAKPVRWEQSSIWPGGWRWKFRFWQPRIRRGSGLMGWPTKMYKGNKDSWESQLATCWGRGTWTTARERRSTVRTWRGYLKRKERGAEKQAQSVELELRVFAVVERN